MKQILISSLTVGFVSFCMLLQSQDWMDFIPDAKKGNPSFFDVKQAYNEYVKFKDPAEIKGNKQYKRWELYMQARVDQNGEFPADTYWKEYQKVIKKRETNQLKSVNWLPVGPFNIPEYQGYGMRVGVGRIDCIAFHPTDENTIWIGTPAGGAWKTDDNGGSWQPKTDDLPTLGISDIIFHPVNPDIMYIATGERDAWNTFSIGVLKSFDGGDSWETTGLDYLIPELKSVNKLLINPDNPDELIAATNLGIYKTINGGLDWQQVLLSGHFKDMVYKPGDVSVIYASSYNFFGGSRIYKSTDGGDSFSYITNSGMSYYQTCRIKLGVSPDNPSVLYALNCKSSSFGLEGFYRSLDEGNTWEKLISGSEQDLVGYSATGANLGGQAFYNLSMVVSPTNINEIFVGGTHIWKSIDGGETFVLNDDCYQIAYDWIHADIHEFSYNPHNQKLYAGCDGGIYESSDSGLNWIDISEGLQITQSYRLGISQQDPDLMMIGNQDNASFVFNDNDCFGVIGGDGMECMIDDEDTDILYASIQYGALYRSLNGGNNFSTITPGDAGSGAWTTPFVKHPYNPEVIYAGYSQVYRSDNRGNTWNPLSDSFTGGLPLERLEIAPSNDNYIYAATYTNMWRSSDGGQTWTEISEGLPNFSYPSIPFDLHTFYDIEVSSSDPNTVWVTYSNFMEENKVFKSVDGGDTWMNISYNLPNFPVNCIVHQYGFNEGIYVGTDVGVYYIDNDGESWFDVSNGLPNVIVTDMEINYPSNKLVAATHGRGVWEMGLFNPVTSVDNNSIIEVFTMIPNPVNNYVTVQFRLNTPGNVTVSIKDVQGHLVQSENVDYHSGMKHVRLDVSGLARGMYLVELRRDEHILQTKKCIKL